MTTPRPIDHLRDIADSYDALLCDIWGVVHNGRQAFPDAVEAIQQFQAARGPVALISNSPRRSRHIPEQFEQLGAPGDLGDVTVTSGDATRAELMRRAPGPAFRIGPERDERLYEDANLKFAGRVEDAAFLSCTGLFDDETEEPEDYRDMLSRAAERGLPMVCANPDRVVMRGDKMIWCAGALAELFAELGGEVILAGKPHPPIYRLAFERLDEAAGRKVPRGRILAIGDSLANDVAGANAQGIDMLFIGEGIHGADIGHAGGIDAIKLGQALAERNLTARYAAPRLIW